jgi:penicillin G amidase
MDQRAVRRGYARSAEREERALDPGARKLLDAYLRGLNSGLALAARRPPPGLRVMGVKPSPWTARDVLAFGRFFGATLSNAGHSERERLSLMLAGTDDAAVLWQAVYAEPFPPVPPGTRALLSRRSPPDATSGKAGSATSDASVGTPATVPDDGLDGADEWIGRASNAWAVAPRRSATGGALVAGDPHIDLQLPPAWYEIRMEWPGGALAGASLPGAPGVMIGHNGDIAWSFTATVFDDEDLFLAEVDRVDAPSRYLENGTWHPFAVEHHPIVVKGATVHDEAVRTAGPAVFLGPSGIEGVGLLSRWVLAEQDGLVQAFLALGLARTTSNAVEAARGLPGPPLNLIVGGRDRHIAHAIVGRYPVRRGENWDGRVPAPWAGPGMWDGFIPPDKMPLELDPPAGFVASANDAGITVAPPARGLAALTGDFEQGIRIGRIREVLGTLAHATPEDMERLQLDVRSGTGLARRAIVAACAITGPAADLIDHWNGDMGGSGAPLLDVSFAGALSERVRTRTRLGQQHRARGDYFSASHLLPALLRAARDNAWIAEQFDDPATAWAETPCDQVRAALDEGWKAVQSHAGPDPARWGWEPRHPIVLHSPAGVGPLSRLFDPQPVGVGGSAASVCSEAFALSGPWDGAPYTVSYGPSYRLVAAFDAPGLVRSVSALPGGEDEHPHSRHAFDRLGDYAAGKYSPLVPAEPPAEPPLTLVP